MGGVADWHEQSVQQLRSEPAVRPAGRVLAAAVQGPQDRRGASCRYIIAERHHESSEAPPPRVGGPDRRRPSRRAYWTLKAALANVTVQQRSLELAEDLVRQNRARVGVGQAPPLDLVQAEAEVAQRRENLIRAGPPRGRRGRLRRLIMDPADAAFWRAALDPVEEPRRHRACRRRRGVAGALKDRYDLAARAPGPENAPHERGVLRQPEAA